MTERDYLLALHRVEYLGPITLAKLHERFGSYQAIWWAKRVDLEPLIPARVVRAFQAARDRLDPGVLAADLDRRGVATLTILDDSYPALLRETHAAPTVLYLKGTLPSGPSVSIVGTRKVTAYGRSVATLLARSLAEHGVTIVSGLAYGIDVAAHRAALDAGGSSIAVLASPAGSVQPVGHTADAQRIASSGAILTEYPPDFTTQQGLFPARNRIIAGLSPVTVVVEAPEQSGALITARLALAENRDVLAVPGEITNPSSAGTNRLIREGAGLIQSPSDVLAALGLAPRAAPVPIPENATEAELIVALDGPTHFDTIAERLSLSAAELGSLLTVMEVKGAVRHLGGSIYSR